MALFPKNPNESLFPGGKKHFTEVIKNDQSGVDQIAYVNSQEDFNIGSTLIVGPGEQAIFLRDGQIVGEPFGPGRYVLETNNYPFVSRLVNAVSGGVSSFHCTVVFFRTVDSAPMGWGTATPIQVYDREFGLDADIRGYGQYILRVADPRALLVNLMGDNVSGMDAAYIGQQLEGIVVEAIRAAVAEVIGDAMDAGDDVMNVLRHGRELKGSVCDAIAESGALDRYGLVLTSLSIMDLHVSRDSPYYKLRQQNAVSRQKARDMGNFAGAYPNAAWSAQQSVEVMHHVADNPAGGVASAAAGLGMGLGAMPAFGAQAASVFPGVQPVVAQQPAGPTCPKCGAPASPGSRFCSVCGTPLAASRPGGSVAAPRFCASCGAELAAGANFCPSCGTRV